MEYPSEQEITSFVGRNAAKYLKKWADTLNNTSNTIYFNTPAFFFGVFWFIYRKMYKALFILIGIIILAVISEGIIFVLVLGYAEPPQASGSVMSIIAAIICGLFANKWYLSHTLKKITEIKKRELTEDEYSAALSKAGGTNLLGVLLVSVILIVCIIAYMIL